MIVASAKPDAFTDEINTIIMVRAERDGYRDNRPALGFSCHAGTLFVQIGGEGDVPLSDTNDEWRITYRFDRSPPQNAIWSGSGWFATVPDGEAFMAEARKASQLLIRMTGFSDTDTFSFDLTGVFDTPAQGNLDHCGTY